MSLRLNLAGTRFQSRFRTVGPAPGFAFALTLALAFALTFGANGAWAQSGSAPGERHDARPHRFGGPPAPANSGGQNTDRQNSDRQNGGAFPGGQPPAENGGRFHHDHNGGFGRGPMRPGPHAGDWLRKFKDLSPSEQEKSLKNDPHFQQLPPDRQERLRQRLREFDNLPPEEKQRITERMEKWDSLSQEQKQRIRDLQDKLHAMPDDRRNLVHKQIRTLIESSPEERRQTLNSEQFRNSFNEEERGIIQGVMEIQDPNSPNGPPKFDF